MTVNHKQAVLGIPFDSYFTLDVLARTLGLTAVRSDSRKVRALPVIPAEAGIPVLAYAAPYASAAVGRDLKTALEVSRR